VLSHDVNMNEILVALNEHATTVTSAYLDGSVLVVCSCNKQRLLDQSIAFLNMGDGQHSVGQPQPTPRNHNNNDSVRTATAARC
jgi:hypothetical protein